MLYLQMYMRNLTVPNGITECYKRNIRKDIPLIVLIISVLYRHELRG